MSVAELSPFETFAKDYESNRVLSFEAIALSGIVIQIGNRIKEFTEHTIFIDHHLEEQLVIPAYASLRAKSETVRTRH
jgi:hypothetical protein